MKIHLEPEDIQAITQAVIEGIKPLLSANGKDKTEDVIFTPESLANYLQVDTGWIYKHQKALRYFKVGKYVRFHKKDVDKYCLNHTMPALPDTKKEKKKKDLTPC